MLRYVIRRLAYAAMLMFVVSSASVIVVRLAPGDFAIDQAGLTGRLSTVKEIRDRYGLDRSTGAQYREWLLHVVRFDFGRSLMYDRPVSDLVPERAVNTAILALSALLVATIVGLPLGVIAGSRPDGVLVRVVAGCSVLLLSMPPLLTSLLLVFLAARTGWLPIGGIRSVDTDLAGIGDRIAHMIVPVIALALPLIATIERLQSQAMQETLTQPFMVATRARGVPGARAVWRDALKPSLRPILAVYGLLAGSLLSGSFVVEMITAWPGLGRLMLDGLRARDMYLVAGCAAAGAAFLSIATLLSDLAYAAVQPQVRD